MAQCVFYHIKLNYSVWVCQHPCWGIEGRCFSVSFFETVCIFLGTDHFKTVEYFVGSREQEGDFSMEMLPRPRCFATDHQKHWDIMSALIMHIKFQVDSSRNFKPSGGEIAACAWFNDSRRPKGCINWGNREYIPASTPSIIATPFSKVAAGRRQVNEKVQRGNNATQTKRF